MKRILFLLPALAALALVTCNSPGGAAGYSFPNQPLQGKIGGVSWTYVSGTADSTVFAGKLWMELYDVSYMGPGPFAPGAYFGAGSTVLFTISPVSVGLRPLAAGLGQQTVTLYDKPGTINYVCMEGAVEILTLDAVNGVMTGRMDAKFDANNYVSGNFTAAYR